jgi:hypothetical protein
LSWARNRLDGAPGYRLELQGADGRIMLRVTAMSGEAPLTPLSDTALLNGRQARDERAGDTLTFLSYKESSSRARGASTPILAATL